MCYFILRFFKVSCTNYNKWSSRFGRRYNIQCPPLIRGNQHICIFFRFCIIFISYRSYANFCARECYSIKMGTIFRSNKSCIENSKDVFLRNRFEQEQLHRLLQRRRLQGSTTMLLYQWRLLMQALFSNRLTEKLCKASQYSKKSLPSWHHISGSNHIATENGIFVESCKKELTVFHDDGNCSTHVMIVPYRLRMHT